MNMIQKEKHLNNQETSESNRYIYEYVFPYRIWKGFGKEYRYEICIVSSKNSPDIKLIRFRKRYFGISKKMKLSGETQPQWINQRSFNLNPKKDFPRFYDIINKYKQGKLEEVNEILQSIDFDDQTNQISKLTKSLKRYSEKTSPTKQENKELIHLQKEIDQLITKINNLNNQNRQLRLQNFKTNTTSYKKVLSRIKSNLEKESNNEAYFQEEFSHNKWIFGPWYEDVLPKRKADAVNEPDFVLKRFDGFVDIVEIESPSRPLFRIPNKSDKTQPRAELIQALSQVMDYIDSYNNNFPTQFFNDYFKNAENPLNPYRPKGLVIIGRDKKSERNSLRRFNSFLNNIMIITYDEIIHNAVSIIELVSRLKV